MAPARPYWKGYLKLSLVSCPIALYTGTSATERVSFRQINKKTGNRLRQQLVDEITREPVEGSHKGRGYEYAKNAYIAVDDDELDAIAIESNHTIEIDSFVPREQIDERYLDTPYYIRRMTRRDRTRLRSSAKPCAARTWSPSVVSCSPSASGSSCSSPGQGPDRHHSSLPVRGQGCENAPRQLPPPLSPATT